MLTTVSFKNPMIRLFKIIIFLFILPFSSIGQHLDYPLGEVLFQLNDNTSIQDFITSIEVKYSNHIKINDLELVSKPFRIWKVQFDHTEINERSILKDIKYNPNIVNAQFNYFTENRIEPNDPNFPNLWYLKNTGQTGGNPEIDLDATLAWNQTTGGISYTGDTIVVCIIDDNFDNQHEDLIGNIWINDGEIPGNGIDDDGNNYIDDYRGWNASLSNDEIVYNTDDEWHGTSVCGITGAMGDNNLGISGICWNTKLMLVSRGTTTADAIAAYTYPFENRKLYNQTLGQQGAFVVATNSSWGIDYGTPDDAPLWCAMYDSLGSVGILNASATTNLNVDVDQVGDLPTTCQSDFLITTTSVNWNDELANVGFGSESVDLAAFGTDILTTLIENTYGYIDGTSTAAPQVAGTIGLLYTAPCPSFAAFAKSNPQQAALQLKNYILDGVESNASLEGISVTGGRLNTNNSLELLMSNCDFSGCFAPYLIEINNISETSIMIDWLTDIATNSVNLRYRNVNDPNWLSINSIQNPYVLTGLDPCTLYEFQLQSVCENTSSSFTASFTFNTDGCCSAPDEINIQAIENGLELEWNEITAAISYNIRYRITGATEWLEVGITESSFTLENLAACQEYEVQISTICPSFQSVYSSSYFSSTLGCGGCVDFDFCPSSGPPESVTWINQVSTSNLDNFSEASNSGYHDFTNLCANFTQGFSHEIIIKTDFDLIQIPGYFGIWIDLNQNGIFEESELLHQSTSIGNETSGALIIPSDAPLGSARMRIVFSTEILSPCAIYEDVGEVEDYCVSISEASECLPPINLNHIVTENSALLNWSGNLLVNEYMFSYRAVGTSEWLIENTSNDSLILTDLQICTDYEYFLTSICNGETSMPTTIQGFRTKGCGVCMDQEYCGSTSCNTTFEWLQRFILDDIDNESGFSDLGYTHFQAYSADLYCGVEYPISLEPGFSNDPFDERFKVWIDFDQNGIFEEAECILDTVSYSGEQILSSIFIPVNALVGSTRMRVSMKYSENILYPCESGFFGEIEEYCVNIYSTSSPECSEPTGIYSVESNDFSTSIIHWDEMASSISFNTRYRPLNNLNEAWRYITTSNNFLQLEDIIPCTEYEVQVQNICEIGLSEFSESHIFILCSTSTATILEQEPQVSIYPNPFVQTTTLTFGSPIKETLIIKIYSSIGQLVKSFKLNANLDQSTFQIDLSDTNSGIYFAKIYLNDKAIFTEKIIHYTP